MLADSYLGLVPLGCAALVFVALWLLDRLEHRS